MSTPADTAPNATREQIEKLNDLIKDINMAMLVTAQPDGTLRSRPMATQAAGPDGHLWFFTSITSGKVHEIENDQNVNVSYAEPDDNRYVSVSGTARIVRDAQKIHELWNPMLKAWFPKGKDDPSIALIRVTTTSAEYWDAPNGTMVQLYGYIKSALTGKSPTDIGEHGTLRL